jgi:streptomycin 6-kinase
MSPLTSSAPDPRTAGLARQWGMTVTETRCTPSSHLAFGRRGSVPVVLKTLRSGSDEGRAAAVLQAFHGRGMVRLLESVPGAVLLERLCPGTPVATRSLSGADDEATQVLAAVLSRFPPARGPAGCPTVEDWGKGFSTYLGSDDEQIPRGLVERAQAWYQSLARSQRRVRLLHGDFHHYNVLSDQGRGWLAIDPKGVIGEVEYELGAALRNPAECLPTFASPRAIERRLSQFGKHLRLNLDRVLGWAYAQAALSAIWSIEDGQAVSPDDPTVALARRLEPMLPASP